MSTLIEPWHALGLAPWSIFFSSQNLSHLPLIYVPSMQRCREMIIFADFIHDVLSLYLKVPVGFSPIRFYFVFWCLWRFSPIRHSLLFFFCLWWLVSFSDLTKKSVARINRIMIWPYSIYIKKLKMPQFSVNTGKLIFLYDMTEPLKGCLRILSESGQT